MGRSTDKETRLSEQRKYRSWTAQQKIEIVLAGLRGDRSVKEVCREHAISETLYYGWREKLLEGGREALAGKEERQGERELRRLFLCWPCSHGGPRTARRDRRISGGEPGPPKAEEAAATSPNPRRLLDSIFAEAV